MKCQCGCTQGIKTIPAHDRFVKDIIPLRMVEDAVADGWEVTGYSEFVGGIPKAVDIKKPLQTNPSVRPQ